MSEEDWHQRQPKIHGIKPNPQSPNPHFLKYFIFNYFIKISQKIRRKIRQKIRKKISILKNYINYLDY